jgi:hypothetical protein
MTALFIDSKMEAANSVSEDEKSQPLSLTGLKSILNGKIETGI